MVKTLLGGTVVRGEELRSGLDATRFGAVLERLQADMNYLASDELEGRDVGTPGIEAAARYIAESFAASGLSTELFESKPFQEFAITIGSGLGAPERNRLAIRFGGADTDEAASGTDTTSGGGDAEPGAGAGSAGEATESAEVASGQRIAGALSVDFRPLAIGGNGVARGPLVFAGYGISSEERGYDDYSGLETEGAIVMILRKEPPRPEAEGTGGRDSRHAFFETKVRNASAHGAAGVLLINDVASIEQAVAGVRSRVEAERRNLDELDRQLASVPAEAGNVRERLESRRRNLESMIEQLEKDQELAGEGLLEIGGAGNRTFVEGLPVVSLSRPLASKLLYRATGKTLDELQAEIDREGKPSSLPLDALADLEVELTASEVPASNVIGVLPGRGELAEQTVVVGAHYDHVGMGGPGSLAPGTVAIHNGADDNASGTTVMLASVDRIRELLADVADHRRVVFIAFTGEERGLLGSEHYVRNPRFALESTVAMVNLDMVGRLSDNDLTVYGTGTSPRFDDLLDRANQRTGFSLYKVASGYGPSDHQSFYTRKVPVLFFFTGLHSDYHRPSDTADKINFTGMARITDLASTVAAELATTPTPPEYAETSRDVRIRRQGQPYLGVTLREPTAEEADAAARQPDAPRGVFVAAVAEGGPAEQAGIRAGDRLLKFDEVALGSIGELIEAVGSRDVNTTVKLELERDGERRELSATLRKRPGE